MTVQQAIVKNVWLYDDYGGTYYRLLGLKKGKLECYMYTVDGHFFHSTVSGIQEGMNVKVALSVREKIMKEDPPHRGVMKALLTHIGREE